MNTEKFIQAIPDYIQELVGICTIGKKKSIGSIVNSKLLFKKRNLEKAG